MRYRLELDLYADVFNENFQFQSVGRLAVTLNKKDSPSRWPSLLHQGEGARPKPSNMIVWWDVLEKYESELESWQKENKMGGFGSESDDQESNTEK